MAIFSTQPNVGSLSCSVNSDFLYNRDFPSSFSFLLLLLLPPSPPFLLLGRVGSIQLFAVLVVNELPGQEKGEENGKHLEEEKDEEKRVEEQKKDEEN